MKVKVHDRDFGDMILDVVCEDKKHLHILRRKDVQFTLEQDPGNEQCLFVACCLEDGEWDKNYSQFDWEMDWPCDVGFVTRVRNRRNISGENVYETWEWSDFDTDDTEEANAETICSSLYDCLMTLVRHACALRKREDYSYITAPEMVDEEAFASLVEENTGRWITFDKSTLCFRISDSREEDDRNVPFACAADILKDVRAKLCEYIDYEYDDELGFTFAVFTQEPSYRATPVSGCLLTEFVSGYTEFLLYRTGHREQVMEWRKLPKPDSPYAKLPEYAIAELDLYSHSGDSWSYHGCGMQCRWDTSSYAGILYFEPDALASLREVCTEEEVREIVKRDFDLTLHLLSDDTPDLFSAYAYSTLGKLMHDGDTIERYSIFYDSFKERDDKFREGLECYLDDKYEEVEFEIVEEA